MHRNQLTFENLFQPQFCEMRSLCIILIQFNIFQQGKQKRHKVAFKLKQTNQNKTTPARCL